MSSADWFNDVCARAPDAEHLDYVTQGSTRIVTVFEDMTGKDADCISTGERARLHYGVLNGSHRFNVRVEFETGMKRGAIKCNGSDSYRCHVIAYRKLNRKSKHAPNTELMFVEVDKNTAAPEETFITAPTIKKLLPNVLPQSCKEMRNQVKIGFCDQGGRQMRRDYLKAIGKAVASLAGPLGAPLEGLLVLYENEQQAKKDKLNEELHQLVSSTNEISRESLTATLKLGDELKCTQEIFVKLFAFFLDEIRHHPATAFEQTMELATAKLLTPESTIDGISERRVINELRFLFEDRTDLFIAAINSVGFPTDVIRTGAAGMVVYFEFVKACRGQSPRLICDTFKALYQLKPGSNILNQVANVFCEYSSIKTDPGPKLL